ncbi:hypothetical protein ACN28S_40555 [Cystobacter fuscus]
MAAGPDSINLALSASTVAQGTPVTLTARADDTRYGTNGGTEGSQTIAAARYSIDAPSWVSGTPTFALSAVDGGFNSTAESVQATVFTSGRRRAGTRSSWRARTPAETGACPPPSS